MMLLSGIGRCIVKELVKCGASVIALSRTSSTLDTLKTEVFKFKFKFEKGSLKHIHIYSNHTQYDNTKIITNIKYPL